jgi:cardiolipin synthase
VKEERIINRSQPTVFHRAFTSLKQLSHRLSQRLLKHVPGLPGPLAEWIPLLLLLFVIGVGIAGWLTQRVIRTDKQEAYHYLNPIAVDSPAFERSTVIVAPLVSGNSAAILNNGDAIFPAMLRDIANARNSINLETFIIRSDPGGEPFIDALAAAAKRGVQVRLLYDAMGSTLTKEDRDRLREAGVHLRKFRPLFTFRLHKVSERTHRKILVVDGRIAFTGGAGLAKEWLGNARNPKEWRETQVRVEGPVAAQMQTIFAENWIYSTGEVLIGDAFYPELKPVGTIHSQAMRTARGDASTFSKMLYYVLFQSARKRIYITNPYFIPDSQIREALTGAAERGVDVAIVLPGENSDARMIRAASWFHYGALLKSGVRIYEYQPTMMHAKNVVIDGLYSTIGSVNFDLRSMKVNAENSLAFYDKEFGSQMEAMFREDTKRSREITYKEWKRRSYFRRLIELAARIWEPYY